MQRLNFYKGYYNTVNHFLNYKNPILNYFKDIYNDCFVPSFMNNNKDELNRNKHSGAHIMVKSFTVRPNGFRDYNQVDYYYVTNSQVNIVNHYYFSLSKSVVNNAKSNNKFMFITPNSLFVCNRDFIIEHISDIKYETNVINKNCFYIPVEECEMIPFNPQQYSGFYNVSQWKPRSIGFYTGKVAGNEFRLVFPNLIKKFDSVSECYRWIKDFKGLTYNKSERSLSGEIKNKGEVKFVEGIAKVEWICGKLERNADYDVEQINLEKETTTNKRVIKEYVEEQERFAKEWEEFQKETIKELETKKASSSVKRIVQDNSQRSEASDVIIKSNYTTINNNININNNIGSETSQRIILDNNIEWKEFVCNSEIFRILGRRLQINEFIMFKKGKLNNIINKELQETA